MIVSEPLGAELVPNSTADEALLDHPIWSALTTSHMGFALTAGSARRYPEQIGPFAAIAENSEHGFDDLLSMLPPQVRIAMFTLNPVSPPQALSLQMAATCFQMIAHAPIITAEADHEIFALSGKDVPEMMDLVGRTKPGPFAVRTHELGAYLGIRDHGKLVAMAGERMRVGKYIEVSAVCVDPEYRGRGYGKRLIGTLSANMRRRGEIPFLHVFTDNEAAIALYETLGFKMRRQLHVTAMVRR